VTVALKAHAEIADGWGGGEYALDLGHLYRLVLPTPELLMGALGVIAQKWLRAMEDSPVNIDVRRKPKPFKLRRGWNPIYAKRHLGR
jgi:hypothetical protein